MLQFNANKYNQVLVPVKTLAIASLAAVAVANPFEFVVYKDGACNGPVADQRIDRPIGSCTSKFPFPISISKNVLLKQSFGMVFIYEWNADIEFLIDFKTGGLYGALILDEYNNKPGCTFKFWELADCHGKATVQHSGITCTPIANKDGQFYLTNGARSASISCWGDYYISMTTAFSTFQDTNQSFKM